MTDLDIAVDQLARRYPGPGGACAVLRDGEVLARHAWGFANAERRIPFTPATLFRMCSITKQFTCGVVLDAFPDPAVLDGAVRARLPLLEQAPNAVSLCHNQSGLRDYWAVAMLHGAPAESAFGETEAAQVIGGAQSLQFAPGSRYSYCNQNFRILSDAVQEHTGRRFAELLRTRIFEPAGMHTAFLAADTRAMPDGTEGYEGTPAAGFRPAVNRILWTGDAGLGASLDDMIAWERFIDRGRDDPGSLYAGLAAHVAFADGTPAAYGFGLGRHEAGGLSVVGHGGALRGWRSHRLYVAAERVSVVVMFNHLADAQSAAMDLLRAALGQSPERLPGEAAAPPWLGTYVEPETGLSVRIGAAPPGRVRLQYDRNAELLALQPDGTAGTDRTRLRPGGGGLWMDRPDENQSGLLRPVDGPPQLDCAGRFHCAELAAELAVHDAGRVLYGGFSGVLGQGRMEPLVHVAGDVWVLPMPRALDHTPPGDWTLAFRRDAGGRVMDVQVGCWLARGLVYERVQ